MKLRCALVPVYRFSLGRRCRERAADGEFRIVRTRSGPIFSPKCCTRRKRFHLRFGIILWRFNSIFIFPVVWGISLFGTGKRFCL